MTETRWDAVVIGSGPGGASVARELARAGRRVLILERGRDWRGSPLYGRYPGPMLYADRSGLLFTRQGMHVVRPLMVGGATSMFAGCAWSPAAWWRTEYGIELDRHAGEIADELQVEALPAELRGTVSTRIAEAGAQQGMPWQPQDKFMRPARASQFDCGAHCLLGCRCRAKWSAAEWIDEAVGAGATLRTGARVGELLIENESIRGVRGHRNGRSFTVACDCVVVAAGGIGTPRLLERSGVDGAGQGIAMDTTVMVYGVNRHSAPDDVQGAEPPMTWSCADERIGVLFSTLIDPWLMYPIIMGRTGARAALGWPQWRRTMGIMIKLTDDVSGSVPARGRIDKGMTGADRARLREAEAVAHRILVRAGCDPDSLQTTPARGTHPSATARIGTIVDTDLATAVRGLYVCDASVFPRALGRPTVLTILALGRRLAQRLIERQIVTRAP